MSKEGIGYFSFDTDFFHADKKVKLIKSEFGSKGVTILIYALCAIYSDKGYYAEWGEDDCYLWSEDLGCDCSPNLIGEVINRCVKRGIFDEKVFNASGVLTSHGIQIRFLKAAAKRERIKIIKEYALFDLEELKEGMRNKVGFFSLKVASSSQKVASSSQKVASSKQSKESKVKESKVKQRERLCRIEDFISAYPKNCNRYLTEREYASILLTDKATEDQLVECALNYAESCKILGTQERYIKNAENFLKDMVFEKYLPGKYKRPSERIQKPRNSFHNFEQRDTDYDAIALNDLRKRLGNETD
jgi:hypothetical protein